MSKKTTTTTTTEAKTPTIFDKDIGQADFEKLRSGEKISAPAEKTGETALATETKEDAPALKAGEETEVETETEVDKPAKKSGVQKRIGKLRAKVSAAEQERDHWREMALKSQDPAKAPKPTETKTAQPNGEPKADDFEKHEDYVKALAKWEVKQELALEKKAQSETKVKTELDKKHEVFGQRREAFVKDHSDYQVKIAELEDIPMSLTVRDVLLDSEQGPELAYELAKDPANYEKICKMPALQAARELGKIEARLQKTETATVIPPKKTKAPTPINPLNTSTAAGKSKTIYDRDLSQEDFERLRAEQIKGRSY